MNYYKTSYYNHIIEIEHNQILLFNARTLATIELNTSEYNHVEKLLTSLNREIDTETFDQLQESGFIIKTDFDEKQSISRSLWKARNSKKYMSLTIAPTMGCNFNCHYCFESESIRENYHIMTDDIQEKLYKFVKNHVEKYKVEQLEVCWFGGEPLLGLAAIKNLSQLFLDLSEKNNIKYSATIITNGYRLKPEIAKTLRQLKITSAQVTIDGPEKIHDGRRFLKGGMGSFKRIVKNIEPASKELDILIRVNVDKQNRNYLNSMLEEILEKSSNQFKPNISLAPVHIDPNIKSEYQAGINEDTFKDIEVKFIDNALEKNFNFSKKPDLVNNACAADHQYSYMIGPHGELYHCWEDFGRPELCVGTLSEGRVHNLDYVQQYYDFDPTEHQKCASCKVLPLCMGGCPKRRLQHNGIPQCGIYKKNLRQHLLLAHGKYKKINIQNTVKDVDGQIRVLSELAQKSAFFHKPIPNNYVLLMINKRYHDHDEYLKYISELTKPLNIINLSLLKICRDLLNGIPSPALKSWAVEIKNNTNLRSIPYMKQVISDIEKNILNYSFSKYLKENHPEIIQECHSLPKKLLTLLRLNVYLEQKDVNTALKDIINFIEKNQRLQQVVERIEIAKMDLDTESKPFPKIILYFEDTNKTIKIDDYKIAIKQIIQIFEKYPSNEINKQFCKPITKNITITQGYKLYKQLLESIGLIEDFYIAENNYAFYRDQ